MAGEVTDDDLQVFASLVLVSDDAENQRRFEAAVAKLNKTPTGQRKGGGPMAAQATADTKAAEATYEAAVKRIREVMKKGAADIRRDSKSYSPLDFASYQRETRLILEHLSHFHKEVRRMGRAADFENLEASKQENRRSNQAQRQADRIFLQSRAALLRRVAGIDSEARRTRAIMRSKEAQQEIVEARERSQRNIATWRRQQQQIRDATQAALRQNEADRRDRQARERASEAQANREALRAATTAAQERLQAQRTSDRQREIEAQSSARQLYVIEQAAEARRTARTRAFLAAGNSVLAAGLRGTQTVWESFWRRREARAASADARELERTKATLDRQTAAIRQRLEQQGSEYTRAAQRRLAQIEQSASAETRAITAAQVRQAEAAQRIREASSGGVLGAATGAGAASSTLRRFLPAVGIGTLLGGSLKAGYDRLTTIEDATASLTVSLQDAAAAGDLLAKVLDVVRGTPFNLDQFANAAQLMVGMGIAAQKVPGYLTAIGEAAATKGKRAGEYAERITEVYGKIQTSGRVYLDQINSLAEAGVNGLAILANEWGVNTAEMRKLISKGAIPAERALDALTKGIIEGSNGIAGSTVALGGSMEKLRQQTSGALGGLKSAYARFGAAVLSPFLGALRATFTGLAEGLDFVGGKLNSFLTAFAKGEGVWKAARTALLGFAGAVAVLLGLKAAIEVVNFLRLAVLGLNAALLANPFLLLAAGLAAVVAGLTALIAMNSSVRGFFKGLVDGTKEWILVGYRLGRPIDELSRLVRLQSSIGSGARTIRDFFVALRDGTRDWIKVGYAIDRPVDELSRMVLLQSSIGAFARAFRDGMDLISSGIEALRRGDVSAARAYGSLFIADLRESLAPAGRAMIESLDEAFGQVQDWLRTEALPRLASARLSTGAFLLTALGLGGGGGGIAARFLRRGIRSVFVGAVQDLDDAESAAEVGRRVNAMMQRAVDYAASVGVSARDLFAGLTGSDSKATDETARALGENLRTLIGDALSRAGDFLAPVGRFLGGLGDTIISGFSRVVLPKLIELPRMLGRFLSANLFREDVLKAIGAAAGALAVAAAVIAVQFVRGFAEGLWERRGDIAAVVTDVLLFVAKAVISSGNPFVIFGSLIVAALGAAKVKGTIDQIRNYFRVGLVGLRGDLTETRKAAKALRDEEKVVGPGARVGNSALAVGNAYRKTGEYVRRANQGIIDGFSAIERGGQRLQRVGQRTFVKGLMEPAYLSRQALFRVGHAAGSIGDDLTSVGRTGQRAMGVLQAAGNTAREALRSGFDFLRNNAAQVTEVAMASAAAAFSGYMLGMADDAESASISIIGSLSSIGAAFATGGPIGAAVAAGASVVGIFLGSMQRNAREARAEAEAVAEASKAIQDSLDASLRSSGSSGVAAQVSAISTLLEEESKKGSQAWREFAGSFDADTLDIIRASFGGADAIKAYTDALNSAAVGRVLAGDREAMTSFSDEIGTAASSAQDLAGQLYAVAKGADSTSFDSYATKGAAAAEGLVKAFSSGEISADEFRSGLEDLGLTTDQAAAVWGQYVTALRTEIANTPGGQFVGDLAGRLREAVRRQREMNEVQGETQRQLLNYGPAADAFAAGYQRIREKIDKATSSYRTWVEATTGERRTSQQAELDILNEVAARTSRATEGLTRGEDLENQLGITDLIGSLDSLIGRFAETAASPDDLRRKFNAFLDDVAKKSPEAASLVEELRRQISDEAFVLAFDSRPAIESLDGFKTEFADFLAQRRPDLKLGLNTGTAEQKKAALDRALIEFSRQNYAARTFIETGGEGGWNETYAKVKEDIASIAGKPIDVKLRLGLEAGDALRDIIAKAFPGKGTGEIFASAAGRLVKRPMLSTLGEDGMEVVLPLTKPNRMAQLLGLPEVQSALANLPSADATGTASSFAPADPATGPSIHHEVKVDQRIYETTQPRLTAAESVRKIREAEFLGGGPVAPFAYAGTP